MKCLFAAARNEIQPTEKSGELLDIALYGDGNRAGTAVRQRGGLSGGHSAVSVALGEHLALHARRRGFTDRQGKRPLRDLRAVSVRIPGGGQPLGRERQGAEGGISEASVAYATSALGKGDYDLGASLLEPDNPEHAELLQQIRDAQRERDARQQRLKTFKRIGAALVATVFVVITVAFFVVRASQQVAIAERKKAVEKTDRKHGKQRDKADEQRKIAERRENDRSARNSATRRTNKEKIAVAQKEIANEKTIEATKQRELARRRAAERRKSTAPTWPRSDWPPPRLKKTLSTGPLPCWISVPGTSATGSGGG